MKVILAGFPKTGTKSMNAALTQLGYNVYDAIENTVLLQDEYIKIFREGWTTDDFRKMYEDVDAVADVPACFFWDEIHKAFPDSKIVLTVRDDEDAWFRSVVNELRAAQKIIPRLVRIFIPTFRRVEKEIIDFACMAMFGNRFPHPLSFSFKLNETMAKKTYRAHNAYVMQAAPKDKLLVFNCSEGWEPLCKFLEETTIPDSPFPHENVKGNGLNKLKDHPIFKRTVNELIIDTIKVTFVVGLMTYCSVKYGPITILTAILSTANDLLGSYHFW